MRTTFRIWRRPGRELLRAGLDLLMPPVCPACGEAAEGLCGACRLTLQRRPVPGCPRCGEPVIEAGLACGSDHRDLRLLVRHGAPMRFAGTGGALVRRFKLDADSSAGRLLARAMADTWAPWTCGNWRRALLVPVPLHRARRRERGFDQAEWLARAVGQRLGLEVAVGVLGRQRPTLPQGDPRVTSRDRNVAGAFTVVRPLRVVGRRIVLVDDVFTSGATARCCAEVLRGAGAREVAILTACRS